MFSEFGCPVVACFIAAFAASSSCAVCRSDLAWRTILTMNDQAMRAETAAEKGGKIIAVGSAADVMKLNSDATKVSDLGGRTTTPKLSFRLDHSVGADHDPA